MNRKRSRGLEKWREAPFHKTLASVSCRFLLLFFFARFSLCSFVFVGFLSFSVHAPSFLPGFLRFPVDLAGEGRSSAS